MGDHYQGEVILLDCAWVSIRGMYSFLWNVLLLLLVLGQAVPGCSGSISGPALVYAVLLAHVSEWKRL